MNSSVSTKSKKHSDTKLWRRVIAVLSCAMILCNTMVMPAMAEEPETYCGYTEHTEHTDECYAMVKCCEYGEESDQIGDRVLVCGCEENTHKHDESCYETGSMLVCSLEEHTHSEACYDENGELICGYDEHVHGENCFAEKQILTCPLISHVHTDECYHVHTEECFKKELICETPIHQHDEQCYSESEQQENPEETTISKDAGNGIAITITGMLPEGAAIKLTAVPEETLEEILEQVGADTPIFAYDITIVDTLGKEWQPDELGAKVSISGLEIPHGELEVVHVPEIGSPEQVEVVRTDEDAVEFEAEGFSIYVGYTVDFHYGDLVYSIPGESDVLLSKIFEELKISEKPSDFTELVFSDPSLVKIEKVTDDWKLTSLEAFNTDETLTMTRTDGSALTIKVTDAQNWTWNNGLARGTVDRANVTLKCTGDYYLGANLVIAADNVTLDLNGHSLNLNSWSLIINPGASLTVINSTPATSSSITGYYSTSGSKPYVWSTKNYSGTKVKYSGLIYDTQVDGYYPNNATGITVNGTLNWQAGTIAGLRSNGGKKNVVTIGSGGVMNMSGGAIEYCGVKDANGNSGAVTVAAGGTLNMSGSSSINTCHGNKGGAVYTEGTVTLTDNASITGSSLRSGGEGLGIYATGSSAVVTILESAQVESTSVASGLTQGDIVTVNGAKLKLGPDPTFSYTLDGKDIKLSRIFTELANTSSSFDYDISQVSSVSSGSTDISIEGSGQASVIKANSLFTGTSLVYVTSGTRDFILELRISLDSGSYVMTGRSAKLSDILTGIGYSMSADKAVSIDTGSTGITATQSGTDWTLRATPFTGEEAVTVTFDNGTQLAVTLTMNIESASYELRGRSMKLSTILSELGKSKTGADITEIDVGDSGFTAAQTTNDWTISIPAVYSGTKTITLVFNDESELALNLTISIKSFDYSLGAKKDIWTAAEIISSLRDSDHGTAFVAPGAVEAVSTGDTAKLTADNSSGEWQVTVLERWNSYPNAMTAYVPVYIRFNDGTEIQVNTKAPLSDSVYMPSIPNVNHASACLKGGSYYHYGDTSWYVRSMESYSGLIGYCIEPGASQESFMQYTENENYWDYFTPKSSVTISAKMMETLIGRVIYYGYHGNIDPSWHYAETQYNNPTEAAKIAETVATQILVWEIMAGERDASFNHLDASYPCSNMFDLLLSDGTYLYNEIAAAYNRIETSVRNVSLLPSFMTETTDKAQDFTMRFDGTKYTVTLTDTNNVLSNYNITTDKSDVQVQISGNTLTLTTASEYNGNDGIIISAVSKQDVAKYRLISYYSYSQQDMITIYPEATTGPNEGYAKSHTVVLGDLTISKAIAGISTSDPFQFELTIEDTSGNIDFTNQQLISQAIPPEMTEQTGTTSSKITFKFELAKDQSLTIKKLIPSGAKVTLKELEHSPYWVNMQLNNGTKSSGDNQTYTLSGPSDSIKVTNIQYEYADLSVKKAVVGKAATGSFNFILKVEDVDGKADFTSSDYMQKALYTGASISGTPTKSEINFTFSLADGKSVSFKDVIPKNAKVTLTETNSGDYKVKMTVDDSTTTGTSREITLDSSKDVVVTNTQYEYVNLSVTKAVAGKAATGSFNFTLKVEDVDGKADFTSSEYMEKASYTGAAVSGTPTKREINFTFSLADGESIAFKDFIPKNAKVTLTETNSGDYKVKMTVDGTGTEGTSREITLSSSQNVVVKNYLYEYADLSVTKAVVGKAATGSFNFTLKVEDVDGKADFTSSDYMEKASYTGAAVSGTPTKSVINFTFSLADGKSVSFKNVIPKNAKVTLTETNSGNYKVKMTVDDSTTTGASREIILSSSKDVVVTNTQYEYVDLNVTKAVAGKAAAGSFNFTLKVEDVNGNADFTSSEYMEKASYDGASISGTPTKSEINFTFSLADSEKISFKNFIPKNAKVTLTETNSGDYKVKMTVDDSTTAGASREITLSSSKDVVVTNTQYEYVDLNITKAVAGKAATGSFNFTLKVEDVNGNADFTSSEYMEKASYAGASISGTPTKSVINFTFSLADGESIAFKNFIPKNAKVTLTENNADDYTVKMTVDGTGTEGASQEIILSSRKDVLVTNTFKAGSVSVKKLISGASTGGSTDTFPMELTITDTSGKVDFTDNVFFGGAVIPSGVTTSSRTKTSVKFTFSLKHNESVEIKNIVPDGAQVTITETDPGIYTPTIKVGTESTEGSTHTFTVSGTGKTEIEVENKPAPVRLTILKTLSIVSGDDKNKVFEFEVEYVDKDSQSQTEAVQLKGGESKTLEILKGSAVTITEKNAGEYTTTYRVNDGETESGKVCVLDEIFNDTTINFINSKYVPDTGINLDSLPYVLALCIMAAGFVTLILRKRARRY